MSNEEAAKKGGGKFKKFLLVLVGLFILVMIIGAMADGDKDGASASSADGSQQAAGVQAEPEPAIEVTPQELEAAYEANEMAAQQQFGGRWLSVTGTIRSIDLDFSDEPYLLLNGREQFGGPHAQLSDASQPKAASLVKGQQVALMCPEVSELGGTPILKECDIQ